MIRTQDEIVEQIKEVIETHAKPAVASHGGNIEFVSYTDGNVLLELQGACSGCAGSTMTLKMGVEGMLRHFVPEITNVESRDGFSNVDPYYTQEAFNHDQFSTISLGDPTQ
jgi:Fe-S cluster biogenesis protein NfuA|tara:strand:+ start:4885 stop:5217 length:333 start_codon:yes stop_codon:yes gene_type:complete